MLKEDWYSGIGNSIQNLSQDAGEIHFSPLRNCYSLSAIKPFKPGEKAGQPAPLGGLLPKIKPHGTQQGERFMPVALWLAHERKSSHWALTPESLHGFRGLWNFSGLQEELEAIGGKKKVQLAISLQLEKNLLTWIREHHELSTANPNR